MKNEDKLKLVSQLEFKDKVNEEKFNFILNSLNKVINDSNFEKLYGEIHYIATVVDGLACEHPIDLLNITFTLPNKNSIKIIENDNCYIGKIGGRAIKFNMNENIVHMSETIFNECMKNLINEFFSSEKNAEDKSIENLKRLAKENLKRLSPHLINVDDNFKN